ncbi:hypothetical protein [Mycobacterium sp. SA01]|uniref:hypothetical protein n=1 Tax=Mycobacterium sp. SA01 TaxID=3238820 RepID=UPI00351BE4C9
MEYPTARIAAVQQRLSAALNDIRSNTAYSDKGRKAEMARATLAARQEAARLKDGFIADRNARREALERRLFGIIGSASATETLSMRDARTRAKGITNSEDAQAELRLANQAGDTFLARAITQVAFNKGWRDVVDTFAATAPPGAATALEELNNIPSGPRTNTADELTFRIQAPTELLGVNDSTLELIARSDQAGAI